jgi:hypothetical protein
MIPGRPSEQRPPGDKVKNPPDVPDIPDIPDVPKVPINPPLEPLQATFCPDAEFRFPDQISKSFIPKLVHHASRLAPSIRNFADRVSCERQSLNRALQFLPTNSTLMSKWLTQEIYSVC